MMLMRITAHVAEAQVRTASTAGHVIVWLGERTEAGELTEIAAVTMSRDLAKQLSDELAEAVASLRQHEAVERAAAEWWNLIWGSPAWAFYQRDGFTIERTWVHRKDV
jgi:hypothetical protein